MRIVLQQFRDTVTPCRATRKRPRIAHGETGLTLIEMIVVLAIIAIVAGLIVGSGILSRPDQARVTVAETDIRTISSALKMYRLDNGDYPTGQQGLKALVEKPATGAPNWNPEGYLAEMPLDPWGRPYVYTYPAPGGFSVVSLGRDGKPGGEGLDADIDGKRG
ncbi:type II secretion system major pseudopilin GspG [Stakelama saccharophila]|uniref:Type II secretion system core protein G n=1 Tax=Stakelama saccharophila TaxID=3075605 RepID=A0ABZ0BCJ6_9SPHN|nr:type II secretion system major pseudopilin GspG [Stakelama sp. W311]WNO54790.1 type II secretion system major pseudopilin GspG [Stakelama sp. W311]